MQIKGEYEITFLIQNMFNSYTLTTRDSNIVTNQGLNFILKILGGKTTQTLGEVCVGTNSTEPSNLDTTSSFSSNPTQLTKSNIEVENNKLTYIIHTKGENLYGTREIGIFSSDGETLITRDVHDRYDVPTSAEITIRYSLTLTNKTDNLEETEDEEVGEEDNNND